MKDEGVYLDHILDCFQKISKYLAHCFYETFLEDEEKQDAVIRKIEVAGEATKQLGLSFRQQYPDIPWRAIAGMRDKLIHGYIDVDLDTVWETATTDIPALMPKIKAIADKLN
jgi:uncharacterized protein with HEPN domain